MNMSKIGAILRARLPTVYKFLVSGQLYLQNLNTPYSIYITDSLGGDFKTYITERGIGRLTEELSSNLDMESRQTIATVCERLQFYPNEQNRKKTSKKLPIAGGLLPVETPARAAEIERAIKRTVTAIGISDKEQEASVFYFHHGLSLLPKRVHEYISGGDFADLGAYIGDSAIALRSYNYGKIFSFDISEHSIKAYKLNMLKADIPTTDYEIIKVAVSDEDGLPDVELPDTGSAGFSLMRRRGKYDPIRIRQMTFDKIVELHGITPRFIKVDIEGYGMKFVRGAMKSLKQHRPVLSIAIYHNPTEFFEIKPLLEASLDNYIFSIRKLTPGVEKNLCHSEVILLAYPKELV